MPDRLEPRTDILPAAQQEIWPLLVPAPGLSSSSMVSAGISLEKALGAFAKIYGKDPGLALRAIGYFKDGDLPSLPKSDQDILRAARDHVSEIPEVALTYGSLAVVLGDCKP